VETLPLLLAEFGDQAWDVGLGQTERFGTFRAIRDRSAPTLFLAVAFDRVTRDIKRRTMFLVRRGLDFGRESGRNGEVGILWGA
jgi:hypothetical protein